MRTHLVFRLKEFALSALLLGLLACSGGTGGAAGAAAGDLLPGSTAGGKPVGLFYFVSSSDFNVNHTYYFTPAGQVYVDPADYTPAALAAVVPAWRGTFAVTGNQMSIKWADGHTTSCDNYHADPTGFGCQGSFMCVGPFAGAQQLAGGTFEGRNAAVSVDANSLAAFNTVSFGADGTLTSDLYVAGHVESRHSDGSSLNTDAASDKPQQAGRWALDGWYLTLTDAQGKAVRGVAYRTDWDVKTDRTTRFNFNGTNYKATGGQ